LRTVGPIGNCRQEPTQSFGVNIYLQKLLLFCATDRALAILSQTGKRLHNAGIARENSRRHVPIHILVEEIAID
jgi:hypothetical protein